MRTINIEIKKQRPDPNPKPNPNTNPNPKPYPNPNPNPYSVTNISIHSSHYVGQTMSIRSLKKIKETINEKQKRRAESLVHVEKRKAVKETVDCVYEQVDELHVELSEAKSRVKEAQKDNTYHQYRDQEGETGP